MGDAATGVPGDPTGVVRWERSDGIAAVPAGTVEWLERHWAEGWNGEDVDTIVVPFGRSIVFSSPFVPRISGDPVTTEIVGFDAVRQYVADSFVRATPGIRYTHDDSYVGPDSVILLYTVHHPTGTNRRGADIMRLGGPDFGEDAGKIVEWRSHYPFA